ncbi:MAG TPA: hypothetical protein VII06_17980 [Chloroflexota bacterium]|jgi:hypothetical protein
MTDLHWTGAALLLAIAVMGGGSARARRDTEQTWEEFARANGIAREPTTAAPPLRTNGIARADATAPPRPMTSPRDAQPGAIDPYRPASAPTGRRTWLRATASCGHCGRAAGDLEWDAAAPAKRAILRPAGGGPASVVPLGARLRCEHCGGPVFAEEPESVVVQPPVTLATPRRGRPRKGDQRAS